MKRVELLTGNKGISLFEILITVTVLSISFGFLFSTFFKSASYLSYISTRYEANIALQNLMQEIKVHLKKPAGKGESWPKQGSVSAGDRVFEYGAIVTPIWIYQRIKKLESRIMYQVTASVRWKKPFPGAVELTTYVAK